MTKTENKVVEMLRNLLSEASANGHTDATVYLADAISNAKQLDEPKECIVKYLGYVPNQGNTWQCDCGYWETVEANDVYENGVLVSTPPNPKMFNYPFCPNCGSKIKRD